ncbi:hypothetical protein GH714_043610 [Hevea brasiliensis]|uniref:Uncharacterized protein n=1 Tax=Hevea brasiliensis TaxID=3981 RepID=A0A6A6K500_HEVBR|nr:hypothetical protein GH714_043610 [Hevea brasiliensis]
MATNKKQIQNLEAGLRGLQNSFSTMEKGVNNKLHHLEEAINKMTALLTTKSTTASSSNTQDSPVVPPLLISRDDSHNQPEGWTQRALVETFMGGLKPKVVDGIRMFKPTSLKEAISLTRMRDEQLTHQRQSFRSVNKSTAEPSSPTKAIPPTKRLTWNEMQKRQAQGLCFNCDEKFTTGHCCKGPQLLILDGEAEDAGIDEQDDSKVFQPKISLHALLGWTTQKTMRVWAKIDNHDVVILIDSGSTHNFINDRMANVLHLPATLIKPFDVKVADGKPLTFRGKFDNVNILIQGIPFALTLYALPLNGLDVVLGIHWLAQLGTVVCNWKQLTMEFLWNNQTQRLEGIDYNGIQSTSMKVISKNV